MSYRVYSYFGEIDYISNKHLAETIQDAWNYEADVYDSDGNLIFKGWLDNEEQNELLEPYLLEVFDYGNFRYLRHKDTKLIYLSEWQETPFKDNENFNYKIV